jgi:hypothetical protein
MDSYSSAAKLKWKINSISFLEVLVAKYIEGISKTQLSNINIYSVLDQLLDWTLLQKIIY